MRLEIDANIKNLMKDKILLPEKGRAEAQRRRGAEARRGANFARSVNPSDKDTPLSFLNNLVSKLSSKAS